MRRIRAALALLNWLSGAPTQRPQAIGASRDRRLHGKDRIRARRAHHA